MKKQMIAVVITLLLATLACTLQNIRLETIDPQIVFISEPVPQNAHETELIFKMSGGKFFITPDASELIEGSIKFNVEAWKPEIIRRDNYVEIKQVNPFNIKGIPNSGTENTWELRLTDALPLRLSIEGGASKNIFDLTGLQLSRLNISQGASDTTIRFDAPNPILLQEFKFTTGASSADLHGLGYANFQQMTFSCGAGDYTLDFSGGLNQDASVDIKSGVSNITIVIPAGLKAVVHNRGTVSNVNTRGTWLVSDQTYSTLAEGYTLTINLNVSVGNINLNYEE